MVNTIIGLSRLGGDEAAVVTGGHAVAGRDGEEVVGVPRAVDEAGEQAQVPARALPQGSDGA